MKSPFAVAKGNSCALSMHIPPNPNPSRYSQLQIAMSFSSTLQWRSRYPSSSRSDVTLHFPKLPPLKNPNFPLPVANSSSHIVLRVPLVKLRGGLSSVNNPRCQFRAHSSDGTVFGKNRDNLADFNFTLESFLSVIESICLVSSAVVSVLFAVRRSVFGGLGDRVLVWVVLVLVCGVATGALIRSRQWNRFFSQSVKTSGRDLNLVERVEKLEEDLRNSATLIRMLSRQLEKLGIRFRVTRKALKEPIAETAALAQKNSEATRALAVQEDILEKELGEIQKVLLAMQEQQEKQLELIVAISKVGKLWDSQPKPTPEKETKTYDSADGGKAIEIHQNQPLKKDRA